METKGIELDIERMNHGHWLKVSIPYVTTDTMTATLQNKKGEMLKSVRLITGNNMIDIEAIGKQAIRVTIDTPFETILRELVPE